MFEAKITPEYGIYANVELIVDATNTDNVNKSMQELEEQLEAKDWSVKTECKFSFSEKKNF